MQFTIKLEDLVTTSEVLAWYNSKELSTIYKDINSKAKGQTGGTLGVAKEYLPAEYLVASPQDKSFSYLNIQAIKDNPDDFFFVLQECLDKAFTPRWSNYKAYVIGGLPTALLLGFRAPWIITIPVGLINLAVVVIIKETLIYLANEGLGINFRMLYKYRKIKPFLFKEYLTAMAHKSVTYILEH